MRELIRITAHSPWGLWPEMAVVGLALMVAPILAAFWPEE